MTLKQWISKNFLFLIIIGLIFIVYLQRCSGCGTPSNPKNYSDTTHVISYEKHDTIIQTVPQIINTYHTISKTDSVKYIASTNYDTLLHQFDTLRNDFLTSRVYKDKQKIDTLGDITIIDTIQKNTIIGRSIHPNLNIPVKTTTITEHIFEKPVNKFYIGGSLGGNQTDYIDQVKLGILFQNKKDHIYGISATATKDLKFGAEVSAFWKIHIGKK